jgi:hypothetical protein
MERRSPQGLALRDDKQSGFPITILGNDRMERIGAVKFIENDNIY